MSFTQTSEIAPITVLSDRIRLLMRSATSPTQMSAMVVDVPPGGFVPPHLHHHEEECYFVLEGALQLSIADQTRTLTAGGFGHVPPATMHGYANAGTAPVRFLAWTVGGPIDEFFLEMNRRVRRMPDDAAEMAELTARFGITMAGPPA